MCFAPVCGWRSSGALSPPLALLPIPPPPASRDCVIAISCRASGGSFDTSTLASMAARRAISWDSTTLESPARHAKTAKARIPSPISFSPAPGRRCGGELGLSLPSYVRGCLASLAVRDRHAPNARDAPECLAVGPVAAEKA